MNTHHGAQLGVILTHLIVSVTYRRILLRFINLRRSLRVGWLLFLLSIFSVFVGSLVHNLPPSILPFLVNTDILSLEAGFDIIVELGLHVADTLYAPFGYVKLRRPFTPSATSLAFTILSVGPFN